MLRLVICCLLFPLLPLSSDSLLAQNTIQLESGQLAPKASIEQLDWIAGYWSGNAFGGEFEEVWTEPMGGTMMGSFKLVSDSKVNFYELITIVEVDETLLLRLKHFDADLKGWEEKEETVEFKLVKIIQDAVYFEGYTFKKAGDDTIKCYVVIGEEGEEEEVEFVFHRKI